MTSMKGTSWCLAVVSIVACGTADNRIDPGDLELRDLLGVSPEAATGWDAPQRASARRVLAAGLHAHELDEAPAIIPLEAGASVDDRVARSLAMLDTKRFAAGDEALGLVHLGLDERQLTATTHDASAAASVMTGDAPAPTNIDLTLSDQWAAQPVWGHLPARGLGVLAAVVADGGRAQSAVVIAPAPRLPVIAGYVTGASPRLVVNPVVFAALEPTELQATPQRLAYTTVTHVEDRRAPDEPPRPSTEPTPTASNGNPYTFFGSYEECAASQRARCESCLPSSSCTPITSTDGNTECTMLAANDGRGYFLECINLALAISSVDSCVGTNASCPVDTKAADQLASLENNADFLDMATCGMELDGCLTKIYGPPSTTFPSLVDGGTAPAPQPPRSTHVDCGDACGSKNQNCTASPDCNCSGPSCNNSLSCDSGCSNSNSQSGGCGDACASSSSSGGGGCGGGGGGGGNSGCSGGSNSSCDSCGSGNNNCNSCGSGGCGSGGCSGNGGNGNCNVAKADPGASFTIGISILWGGMPVPIAAWMRRRSRKRRRPARGEEVAS